MGTPITQRTLFLAMKDRIYKRRKAEHTKRPLYAMLILFAIATVVYFYSKNSVLSYLHVAPEGPVVHNHEFMMKLLKKDPENFRFDWANWTTYWNIGDYSKVAQNPKRFPRLSKHPDFKTLQLPTEDTSFTDEEWQIVITKWFQERMEAPAQIIQLHNKGKPEIFPVQHKDPKRNNKFYDPERAKTISCPGTIPFHKNYIRKIPEENFKWQFANEVKLATGKDKKYLEEYGGCGANCPKYYYEHAPYSGEGLNGQHYDWMFFKKDANAYERQITLQSLARAWGSFASQFQIDYWWSHGAALAWAWNGMALPWDIDLDVEIPIQTFKTLALNFSNSLIIPDPSISKRAYYLDINPYFIGRKRGNYKNLIDGRFIDIHTGSYIDLASLAFDGEEISCKNDHRYKHSEIGTLRYTKFEGVDSYEPVGILNILRREFSVGLYSMEYKKWKFNGKTRLWIYTDRCTDIDYNRNCFMKETVECNEKLDTCDKRELDEYALTKDYTANHLKHFDDWADTENDKPTHGDIFKEISPKHLWHDRVIG